MEEREEIIPDAHVRTFEWLLLDDEVSNAEENITQFQQERHSLRSGIKDKLRSVGVKDVQIQSLFSKEDDDAVLGSSLLQWLRTEGGLL